MKNEASSTKNDVLDIYQDLYPYGPVGFPSKSMTENFNTYPKGYREEKDTFEDANSSWVNEWFEYEINSVDKCNFCIVFKFFNLVISPAKGAFR